MKCAICGEDKLPIIFDEETNRPIIFECVNPQCVSFYDTIKSINSKRTLLLEILDWLLNQTYESGGTCPFCGETRFTGYMHAHRCIVNKIGRAIYEE